MLKQHVIIITVSLILTLYKNGCVCHFTFIPVRNSEMKQANASEKSTSEESSEKLSFFEMLDDTIYQSLSNPKPGCSDKLFTDIDMFHNCLERVKRMYLDMEGEKIESLRSSVVKLYATRGGPTFTRFPIDKPENKKRLIDAFKWNDDNFTKLFELQEKLENVWYAVRHIVI
ncbi:hypothetical protein J6590_066891 [Homalodisca vitripennis]|nr:hypothetical protein J6590_066891 [Homalodisca vitripennis]